MTSCLVYLHKSRGEERCPSVAALWQISATSHDRSSVCVLVRTVCLVLCSAQVRKRCVPESILCPIDLHKNATCDVFSVNEASRHHLFALCVLDCATTNRTCTASPTFELHPVFAALLFFQML